MASSKEKVIVAMSGGVDSSVTASLLVEQGYDVAGVSLRLWEGARPGARNCSDHTEAGRVAEYLGIPHTLLDARTAFTRAVVRPLAAGYLAGRTPNPCVACNRDFKLGMLMNWAREHGADHVATGHYARIVRSRESRSALMRAVDRSKDQSYFLFSLSQEQLARALFPLGSWLKKEVRAHARELGLPVADRPDSQDICLGDYHGVVESFAGEPARGGEIVDRSGRVLGTHPGVHRFTVGQRRGLGLAAAQPLYVLELYAASQRVVVGAKEELGSDGLVASSVSWLEPPACNPITAAVQVRYRSAPVPCRAYVEGDRAEVYFEGADAVVTPGQAAVFYDGERVLGGGWIAAPIPRGKPN